MLPMSRAGPDNLIVQNKSLNTEKLFSQAITSSGSPQNDFYFVNFVMNPSMGKSNSLLASKTDLVIDNLKIGLWPSFLSVT